MILEQDVPITASDLNSEDAEYLVGNAIAGIVRRILNPLPY